MAKYGRANPQDVPDNKEQMKAKWDPTHEDFAKVVCQL